MGNVLQDCEDEAQMSRLGKKRNTYAWLRRVLREILAIYPSRDDACLDTVASHVEALHIFDLGAGDGYFRRNLEAFLSCRLPNLVEMDIRPVKDAVNDLPWLVDPIFGDVADISSVGERGRFNIVVANDFMSAVIGEGKRNKLLAGFQSLRSLLIDGGAYLETTNSPPHSGMIANLMQERQRPAVCRAPADDDNREFYRQVYWLKETAAGEHDHIWEMVRIKLDELDEGLDVRREDITPRRRNIETYTRADIAARLHLAVVEGKAHRVNEDALEALITSDACDPPVTVYDVLSEEMRTALESAGARTCTIEKLELVDGHPMMVASATFSGPTIEAGGHTPRIHSNKGGVLPPTLVQLAGKLEPGERRFGMDGIAYTYNEFCWHYGRAHGANAWEGARVFSPARGSPDVVR